MTTKKLLRWRTNSSKSLSCSNFGEKKIAVKINLNQNQHLRRAPWMPSRIKNGIRPFCCLALFAAAMITIVVHVEVLLIDYLADSEIIRPKEQRSSLFHSKQHGHRQDTRQYQQLRLHQIKTQEERQERQQQQRVEYEEVIATKAHQRELSVNSLIHDKTLLWQPGVDRLWVGEDPEESGANVHAKQKQLISPYKLVLTTYGYNHPNTTRGLDVTRSQRTKELLEGVINHPNFDPFLWEKTKIHDRSSNSSGVKNKSDFLGSTQLEKKTKIEASHKIAKELLDPRIRYYVFLDVETCREVNWPIYNGGYEGNTDLSFNRSSRHDHQEQCESLSLCPYVQQAVRDSILFQTPGINATLVVFDCGIRGPLPELRRDEFDEIDKIPISIVSLSSNKTIDGRFHQLTNGEKKKKRRFPPPDMGLVPRSFNNVMLSEDEQTSIETCRDDSNGENRPIYFSFVGNLRHPTRQALQGLHNGLDRIVYNPNNDNNGTNAEPYTIQEYDAFETFGGSKNETKNENGLNGHRSNLRKDKLSEDNASHHPPPYYKNLNYTELLKRSKFGLVPRGDSLYSYRLTEVLSAGAIPVIYADDWALPFRDALIDWGVKDNFAKKTIDEKIEAKDDTDQAMNSFLVPASCGVIIPETLAKEHTPEYLDSITDTQRCQMRKACLDIYMKYMKNDTLVVAGILETLEREAKTSGFWFGRDYYFPRDYVDFDLSIDDIHAPYKRYHWLELDTSVKEAALSLGYTQYVWNYSPQRDYRTPLLFETTSWTELTEDQRKSAKILGYEDVSDWESAQSLVEDIHLWKVPTNDAHADADADANGRYMLRETIYRQGQGTTMME